MLHKRIVKEFYYVKLLIKLACDSWTEELNHLQVQYMFTHIFIVFTWL